jgi:hypothetical protein
MFRRQISEEITSTISMAWYFTTKSGGIGNYPLDAGTLPYLLATLRCISLSLKDHKINYRKYVIFISSILHDFSRTTSEKHE